MDLIEIPPLWTYMLHKQDGVTVDSLILLHWPCLIAIMYVYLHLHVLGSVDVAHF